MTHGGGTPSEQGDALAPVTYLPGVAPQTRPPVIPHRAPRASSVSFSESYWSDEADADPDVASQAGADVGETSADGVDDRESVVSAASTALARSLGRRGLSVAEARTKLRGSELTSEEIDDVVDDFTRRGWLDDALLAEQLVHTATTRQDMGTKAVRLLLQKRMLARDVIDAVIGDLPDDDAERALEFATTKARSLVRYDDETAMRRLMGQLARRGFGGSVASSAARAALAAARAAGSGSGVRFR